MKHALITSTAALAVGLSMANAQEVTGLSKALSEAKPILAVRLRYEGVDQAGFDDNATALTSRVSAGFETGSISNTKLLVDFDYVESYISEYNSTINGDTEYPVVPDPEVTELNRLQLTNTSIEDTAITIGRQRIKLDDDRFVGNVGWRQNEQTFDALRVVNKSVEGLTVDVSYVNQVNRIFGDDSPMGRWDSNSVLANAQFKVPAEGVDLTLTGFAYLLDFEDDAPAASSQTYGVAAALKNGPLTFKARYAKQSDYAEQPVEFDADYYDVSVSFAKDGFEGKIGYEVLGSDDGVKAFSTPLATLHAFNGFADLFLGTPAAGLEDLYGTISITKKKVGAADLIKVFGTVHDFSSNEGGADYGTEFDAVALAKFGKTTFLVKYADYQADEFAGDRQKMWAEVSWAY
ncbi:hypothetical protein [Parvularcula sp. LCG005]|uniref:hypothetical protein n=1 Tax=Parvularcula sp. LCG005 TaxID=3078805 RepID=UPI002941F784|nr:hypothetical protein [Parvularcula sp. LCG005]WOI52205.1 hypothetical protein RUI03_08565 [Parvularcula sp. LCG005]